MTDWKFRKNEVLKHTETGDWWHVLGRYEEIDSGERRYRLADATHTEYQEAMHAEDVEDIFETAGWTTATKPAAANGYRVNGVLTEPSSVDLWRGTKCVHEYTCPECGEDGYAEIDVIHKIRSGGVQETTLKCRSCNHEWVDDD